MKEFTMNDFNKSNTEYNREKIDAILLSGLSAQFFSPYLFLAINKVDEVKTSKKPTTQWRKLKAKLTARRWGIGKIKRHFS
jgi:hypothetical protein